MVEERFQKKFRTEKCEGLMREDVKALLNLPLNEKIEKSKEIIKEALEKYGTVGVGFSGGTDSLVLLHLILKVAPKNIPILFANTGHQFPRTYEYIEKIKKEWGLENFNEFKPAENRFEEFKEKHGSLTPEFTEACCEYHKIAPMRQGVIDLKLDALITGIRGVEHEERAQETLFSPRESPKHVRVHPILFWKPADVLEYVKQENLPVNPLYAEGYTSLGCTHCTSINKDPDAHERAGRGAARETIMKRLRDLGYS